MKEAIVRKGRCPFTSGLQVERLVANRPARPHGRRHRLSDPSAQGGRGRHQGGGQRFEPEGLEGARVARYRVQPGR